MKKFVLSVIFLIILSAGFALREGAVFADGVALYIDPYSDRWDYLAENNQQVFINYENDLQKMIISVGFDKVQNKGRVWILPIPCEPERVGFDIIDALPKFGGEEISKAAKSNLWNAREVLKHMQIYPFLSEIRFTLLSTAGAGAGEYDVTVYGHIEKEGVVSEVLTARTADGLYNYLRNKGLKIENNSIPVLNHYIGKEYSFVASWMNLNNEAAPKEAEKKKSPGNQKGIYVMFPAKEIYFPLLPTSVYGNKIIPITIRLIGHVSPKISKDIKSYTKVEYYIDSYTDFGKSTEYFYNGQKKNVKYTKIEINAPSTMLTDDLWISAHSPIKTYYISFIVLHDGAIIIFLLILISIITGILAGWLVFKNLRNETVKLGLIGLSNCVSIVGLIITVFFIGTKKRTQDANLLLTELRKKGYIWKRKLAYAVLFVTIPLLFCIVIIAIPFIITVITDGLHDALYYSGPFVPIYLAFLLSVILVMIAGFIIKRIRLKDKELFDKLKDLGYSSWSFQPKDTMKSVFIPVYSISFLVISWVIIELIMLTV
ncbi:MAG: hypothetical protein A3I43_03885 [Omnitrophica WOR_2 bacterium RIFCSPLOWO2_02_FULL_50_19]|nr:MAG: hypothetical protein A3H12_04430 [Candidatus Uhrbacteria bacterium RIFCSPLOWO2_12_FULL_47_9]OGX32542.1 MAG: hypothetical protein A3I43_03885 [Omnitrophica WOR_2 bacterium RIFCSPLOWO2_02_FULL_50_19]